MKQVTSSISKAGAWVSALGTVGIAVLIGLDVFLRNTGGRGIEGVVEVSTVLLVFVAHSGLGAAQRANYHVSTGILTDRLPAKIQQLLTSLAMVISFGFLAVLTVATTQRAIVATSRMESSYGAVNVQLWPARWAIAIGLAWFSIEILISTIQRIRSSAKTVDQPMEGAF